MATKINAEIQHTDTGFINTFLYKITSNCIFRLMFLNCDLVHKSYNV